MTAGDSAHDIIIARARLQMFGSRRSGIRRSCGRTQHILPLLAFLAIGLGSLAIGGSKPIVPCPPHVPPHSAGFTARNGSIFISIGTGEHFTDPSGKLLTRDRAIFIGVEQAQDTVAPTLQPFTQVLLDLFGTYRVITIQVETRKTPISSRFKLVPGDGVVTVGIKALEHTTAMATSSAVVRLPVIASVAIALTLAVTLPMSLTVLMALAVPMTLPMSLTVATVAIAMISVTVAMAAVTISMTSVTIAVITVTLALITALAAVGLMCDFIGRIFGSTLRGGRSRPRVI